MFVLDNCVRLSHKIAKNFIYLCGFIYHYVKLRSIFNICPASFILKRCPAVQLDPVFKIQTTAGKRLLVLKLAVMALKKAQASVIIGPCLI